MSLAAIQMCLGTLYNIGIFAILCSHFQNVFDVHELQLRRQYARQHRNLVQRLFKQMRTHIPGPAKAEPSTSISIGMDL